jgi:hypothetical protein
VIYGLTIQKVAKSFELRCPECTCVLRANQRENGKENRNDRLIAIADGSALYALQQIGQFFTNYQRVLNIEFEVIERGESEAAMALVGIPSTTPPDSKN